MACLRGLGTRRGPPCCTRQRRLSASREACDAAQRVQDWDTAARHALTTRRALTAFKSVKTP